MCQNESANNSIDDAVGRLDNVATFVLHNLREKKKMVRGGLLKRIFLLWLVVGLLTLKCLWPIQLRTSRYLGSGSATKLVVGKLAIFAAKRFFSREVLFMSKLGIFGKSMKEPSQYRINVSHVVWTFREME